MIYEKDSMDRLIRDVIQGRFDATKQAVSVHTILAEVKSNISCEDEEVMRWLHLLDDKKLIRKVHFDAFVPVDLDVLAAKLGVLKLIRSVEEEQGV